MKINGAVLGDDLRLFRAMLSESKAKPDRRSLPLVFHAKEWDLDRGSEKRGRGKVFFDFVEISEVEAWNIDDEYPDTKDYFDDLSPGDMLSGKVESFEDDHLLRRFHPKSWDFEGKVKSVERSDRNDGTVSIRFIGPIVFYDDNEEFVSDAELKAGYDYDAWKDGRR